MGNVVFWLAETLKILYLKKKEPIRTLYQINSVFWLDNLGVGAWKLDIEPVTCMFSVIESDLIPTLIKENVDVNM
jgi:hypothetical protein